MKSHSWTSENDRLLQELWPYMINRDIAARLGCTTDTVAIKARKLGLTKSDKSHVYHERVAVAHRNAALADGRRPPKKRQDWKPAWTPESRAKLSQTRKDIYQRERRRLLYNLPPLTNIPVNLDGRVERKRRKEILKNNRK